MEWILILYISAYGQGGAVSIEYPTRESCEAAGDAMVVVSREIRNYNVETVCLERPVQ